MFFLGKNTNQFCSRGPSLWGAHVRVRFIAWYPTFPCEIILIGLWVFLLLPIQEATSWKGSWIKMTLCQSHCLGIYENNNLQNLYLFLSLQTLLPSLPNALMQNVQMIFTGVSEKNKKIKSSNRFPPKQLELKLELIQVIIKLKFGLNVFNLLFNKDPCCWNSFIMLVSSE